MSRGAARAPSGTLAPLPPGRRAAIAALAVAGLCLLVSVTYTIDDTDLWQHLLVGKAMWQMRGIPRVHLWTWPSYGKPEVPWSWGFRALLWPFWEAGGVFGLDAWRWLTTLLAFGLLLGAARRMGARGLSPLIVMVLCSLTYRLRAQVRPETLVAVLLALEIWVLESGRRAITPLRGAALVAIASAWINVHLSYHLGLFLLGCYAVDAAYRARRPTAGAEPAGSPARTYLWVLSLAVAISFANPSGWRAVRQPFEYFLFWRHEPIYTHIAELQPLQWRGHWKSGLPLLMLGWPVLLAWRARRAGLDVAEALACAAFTAFALSTQRFAGFYALVAAPFVARDLDLWVGSRRWPSWTAPAGRRAALASIGCVLVGLLEWSRPEYRLGLGIERNVLPERACDFMAAHGVKGRGFNSYYFGGYMLWRFWPDRERLPFMDVHQTGSRDDRLLYEYAFTNRRYWQVFDGLRHFDYALIDAHPREIALGDHLHDFLDADSAWALVFRDDAAALFVKRGGPLENVAERFAYRLVPSGEDRVPDLARACQADTSVRRRARFELGRQVAESPLNARAHSILAALAWIERDAAGAREHLRAALEVEPRTFAAHRRLGLIALGQDRPREAIREFEAERRLGYGDGDLNFLLGQAYQRLGDARRALAYYRREVEIHPQNAAAREAIGAMESRSGDAP